MRSNILAFGIATLISIFIVVTAEAETKKFWNPDRPATTKAECAKYPGWHWALNKCRRGPSKLGTDAMKAIKKQK